MKKFSLRTSLAAAAVMLCASVGAYAAAPSAGTLITNQASATYTDASGTQHSVLSNLVTTTVTQVASLTLTQNGAQTSTPNGTVYYPHTVTNTGNGSDTFNLTDSNAGAFALNNVLIYADNGSGQPVGSPITSTGVLAAGASFKFIVVGTVAATATTGQANALTVKATSTFTGTINSTNTDTTTVTNNAVIAVTKAVSAPGGAPGSGPYTYTLSYTNTGNATATSVVISDPIPTGMTYVAKSGLWSVTGSTALSDSGGASGTSPNTLTSTYTSGTNTYAVTIASVAPGQSGTISFQVDVGSTTPPGVLVNTAAISFNDGTGTTVTGSTNSVNFTVGSSASVTLTGATVAGPAAPGSVVSFTNVVTNAGTITDTFNIALGSNNFPAGTTFQLYKADGLTPLTDTNNDGVVDTGPLAAGATYNVILKATLPPNATNVGAPYSITKTATSVNNPTKSATTTDTLTAIAPSAVDITDNAALGGIGVLGTGHGPEGTPVLSNSVNPGASTTFNLFVNNTGPQNDSYNLTSTYSGAALPAGWTVTYYQPVGGSCSTTGAQITSTGTVPAAGSAQVCAVVTVPAIGTANAVYLAGSYPLYFVATSPNSGALDTVNNAVAVNAIRSLVIQPNGTGQTYPGGEYVYTHTLVNEGNVVEGNGTVSTSTFGDLNNQTGWTSTLYYDTNGTGALAANDPEITGALNSVTGLSAGLQPGQSITIFDKVVSPSGALSGAVNATTITVTTSTGTYAVAAPAPTVTIDTTTVVSGNVTLSKLQSLDSACAGPNGATVYSQANLNAAPNQCVLYQVTATNVGTVAANSVVISDATPSFTTLSTVAAVNVGSIAAGAPVVGASGSISANVGTLAPGASAILTFGVRINH